MRLRIARKLATVSAIVGGATVLSVVGIAGSAYAIPGHPNIAIGSSDYWGVQCVQQGVNDWAQRTKGWRPLAVDGRFGKHTETWVKNFQYASFGSSGADGVVGQRTGDALLANLTGDGNQRHDCYYHLPSTHK